MHVKYCRRQACSQDYFCGGEGGGGGCVVKMQTSRGAGACYPVEIFEIWIALDCISRVFVVDKERNSHDIH